MPSTLCIERHADTLGILGLSRIGRLEMRGHANPELEVKAGDDPFMDQRFLVAAAPLGRAQRDCWTCWLARRRGWRSAPCRLRCRWF